MNSMWKWKGLNNWMDDDIIYWAKKKKATQSTAQLGKIKGSILGILTLKCLLGI